MTAFERRAASPDPSDARAVSFAGQLGDLCQLTKGEYPTMKTESGAYPFVVTAKYRRSASTYQLEGPAVCIPLISSTGHGDAAIHRIHYQEGNFALADLLVALKPRDDSQLSAKYLYYLLSARKDQLLVPLMQGTANVSLKEKDIASVYISFPPLEEQQRIVDKIERLAVRIDEVGQLRRAAAEDADALFVSQRADVIGRALELGASPITDAVTLERGKFSHRPRNAPRFFGGEHPWIQIGEIEAANKYIRTWSQTLNDEGLAISREFPRGTILISIAATIGAVGILDFDCCVPDSIVAVTPKDGVDSEFVYHFLSYLRTHLEYVAPQSAQKNVNLRILSGLPFPRISLEEQRRIVSHLDNLQTKMDHLKHLQAQTATELDALVPSILDKAFTGEL